MTLEKKIEHSAKNLAFDNLGVISSKLVTPGETGFPDQIFWLPGGKPFLIEFKRPGEEPTPKQLYIHRQLQILGYQVETHDDQINAFESIIGALEATQLSKEGYEILARARRLCAVLRSRPR